MWIKKLNAIRLRNFIFQNLSKQGFYDVENIIFNYLFTKLFLKC